MRIVHLSDIHLMYDCRRLPWHRWGWRRAVAQLELIGLGRAKRFAEAAASMRRMMQEIELLRPDHLILSGDLTALALDEEFACARKALAAFVETRKLTVIPGNHDRYTAHAWRDRRFERYFGDLLKSDLGSASSAKPYPVVRLLGEEVAVIGLDSTRLASFPGLSWGRIGRQQLGALARLLDDSALRGRACCVMVHHAPLLKNGRPDRPTHGLVDGQALLSLLARRNCTLHHGHVHQRYWLKANADRPHIFNAGSATMEGHQGYWVLEIEKDGLKSAVAAVLSSHQPLDTLETLR